MAISKTHDKKSPNQTPTGFYKLQQFGGPRGLSKQKVGDKLTGGPMMEKIMGRKSLG
jgi:hypothetical protein